MRTWYTDARFGMFIHWGLYSMVGRGEWDRAVSQVPREDYAALAKVFNPAAFDARSFVKDWRHPGRRRAQQPQVRHPARRRRAAVDGGGWPYAVDPVQELRHARLLGRRRDALLALLLTTQPYRHAKGKLAPFAGSAAVLFAKDSAKIAPINDINGDGRVHADAAGPAAGEPPLTDPWTPPPYAAARASTSTRSPWAPARWPHPAP
ncbi:alpha-L-fucosidase [Nonomuraea angiospora]|uniref:alpha-L-fucosidase n=1 Tax=Nonomuraea angiospora TaxID=46172 RepID=UPI0037B378F1